MPTKWAVVRSPQRQGTGEEVGGDGAHGVGGGGPQFTAAGTARVNGAISASSSLPSAISIR